MFTRIYDRVRPVSFEKIKKKIPKTKRSPITPNECSVMKKNRFYNIFAVKTKDPHPYNILVYNNNRFTYT